LTHLTLQVKRIKTAWLRDLNNGSVSRHGGADVLGSFGDAGNVSSAQLAGSLSAEVAGSEVAGSEGGSEVAGSEVAGSEVAGSGLTDSAERGSGAGAGVEGAGAQSDGSGGASDSDSGGGGGSGSGGVRNWLWGLWGKGSGVKKETEAGPYIELIRGIS